MRFAQLLERFRDRAGFRKVELARKLGVTDGYIRNLESSRQKPPTAERVQSLIKILDLSNKEAAEFKQAATIERIPKKYQAVLSSSQSLHSPSIPYLSPAILEALQDPVAVQALLITHKNAQDIKEAIRSLLETLPSLSPEKRQAILALCK